MIMFDNRDIFGLYDDRASINKLVELNLLDKEEDNSMKLKMEFYRVMYKHLKSLGYTDEESGKTVAKLYCDVLGR